MVELTKENESVQNIEIDRMNQEQKVTLEDQIQQDEFDQFLDYHNSYDKFEAEQIETQRAERQKTNSIADNDETEISILNIDGTEKTIVLKEIEEKISFIVSEDKFEVEEFELSEEDLTQETKITIVDDEGNEKQFIISKPEEEILNPFKTALENQQGTESIKDQLLELKEYIANNKDKIKDISIKKGTYSRKIPLKDFINRELNTTNYSSNPDKLGEDIILSLLKPLKIYNNYVAQNKVDSSLKSTEKPNKSNYSVGVNGEEFLFKNYSEDYKNIIIQDKKGQEFQIENNKNITFIIGPEKPLNSIELNLINKGKNLIASTDIPFKISNQDGLIKYQTITHDDYIKNINVTAKEVQKKTHTNKLN